MRPFYRYTSFLLPAALSLLLLNSCTKPESNALYDPNASFKPDPTITGILPSGGAVAGIDTLIIQGTNFSPVAIENVVYFSTVPSAVLAATATQIKIKAPMIASDSVGVRVAVSGSLAFSNTAKYRLSAAAITFGGLASNELSSSLATDAAGNLYTSYSKEGVGAGILKFTPDGSRTTHGLATAGVVVWSGLKFGPSGYLYAARNFRALYRFSPGGGTAGVLWTAFPTGTFILDIDFDANGNLWGGGNNTNIYCVDQNKVITTSPFVGTIRSVRVYNGYLYFAARTDAGEKVWRAQITGTTLGTPEIYFDFGASYPANTPLSLAISSDGTLYIGIDSQDGLVVVTPGKTVTAPFVPYKSLFGTGLAFLAWGKSDDLCASTSNGLLVKFAILGKLSAPYYGATK
jgi:hypothetical protein